MIKQDLQAKTRARKAVTDALTTQRQASMSMLPSFDAPELKKLAADAIAERVSYETARQEVVDQFAAQRLAQVKAAPKPRFADPEDPTPVITKAAFAYGMQPLADSTDNGLRILATWAKMEAAKDPEGNFTAGDLVQARLLVEARDKSTRVAAALPRIVETLGFDHVPKSTIYRIANQVLQAPNKQVAYETMLRQHHLTDDTLESLHARNAIRAALNSNDPEALMQYFAQELAEIGEDELELESDTQDIPHDEDEEEAVTFDSPITGKPIVMELAPASASVSSKEAQAGYKDYPKEEEEVANKARDRGNKRKNMREQRKRRDFVNETNLKEEWGAPVEKIAIAPEDGWAKQIAKAYMAGIEDADAGRPRDLDRAEGFDKAYMDGYDAVENAPELSGGRLAQIAPAPPGESHDTEQPGLDMAPIEEAEEEMALDSNELIVDDPTAPSEKLKITIEPALEESEDLVSSGGGAPDLGIENLGDADSEEALMTAVANKIVAGNHLRINGVEAWLDLDGQIRVQAHEKRARFELSDLDFASYSFLKEANFGAYFSVIAQVSMDCAKCGSKECQLDKQGSPIECKACGFIADKNRVAQALENGDAAITGALFIAHVPRYADSKGLIRKVTAAAKDHFIVRSSQFDAQTSKLVMHLEGDIDNEFEKFARILQAKGFRHYQATIKTAHVKKSQHAAPEELSALDQAPPGPDPFSVGVAQPVNIAQAGPAVAAFIPIIQSAVMSYRARGIPPATAASFFIKEFKSKLESFGGLESPDRQQIEARLLTMIQQIYAQPMVEGVPLSQDMLAPAQPPQPAQPAQPAGASQGAKPVIAQLGKNDKPGPFKYKAPVSYGGDPLGGTEPSGAKDNNAPSPKKPKRQVMPSAGAGYGSAKLVEDDGALGLGHGKLPRSNVPEGETPVPKGSYSQSKNLGNGAGKAMGVGHPKMPAPNSNKLPRPPGNYGSPKLATSIPREAQFEGEDFGDDFRPMDDNLAAGYDRGHKRRELQEPRWRQKTLRAPAFEPDDFASDEDAAFAQLNPTVEGWTAEDRAKDEEQLLVRHPVAQIAPARHKPARPKQDKTKDQQQKISMAIDLLKAKQISARHWVYWSKQKDRYIQLTKADLLEFGRLLWQSPGPQAQDKTLAEWSTQNIGQQMPEGWTPKDGSGE